MSTSEPPPPSRDLMVEYEQKAETACSAMYDPQPWDEKDLKDDALFFLARAIEVADALGLEDDAGRLRARVDNIMGVDNSQFRGKSGRLVEA